MSSRSKNKSVPPLPPWQRLHEPVAPPPDGASEEKALAAAAGKGTETAAAADLPTGHPSNEPNKKKTSGDSNTKGDSFSAKKDDVDNDSITQEINMAPPSITLHAATAAKNKKKGPPSKKPHGNPNDSDSVESDDEPTFKDFKAVKCPRVSVSAAAYAKRLRENEGGATTDASPHPSLGDASADDIDALATSIAESTSFDKPRASKNKKVATPKASPKKKSAISAKAARKTATKPVAVAPTTTTTQRSSSKNPKTLPESYLNALENGLDGEKKTNPSQRSSRRQRTQVVPFKITDAPDSSTAHGERAKVASAKKRSSKESKKRKAAEPAAAKKAKVAKKSPTNKKAVAKDAPPRAHHVTAKMEATWKERLEMLKEHKAKYGTVDLTVAEKGEVDQRLRSFVFEQRKQHKNFMRGRHSTLNAERIQELEDLGFVFDPMGSGTQKANTMRRFQQQWDEMYDELVQYKNEHGTTLVPLGLKAKVELKKLGNWVRGQRKLMNKVGREQFDPHRFAKLEAIEFDWNPLETGTYVTKKKNDMFPRVNAKWMSWYNKLLDYKEKNGHIIVGPSTKDYPGLYNWIHGQRKEYIKYQRQEPNANMREEWVKLLNDLNFDWAPMSKGGTFSDMLQKRTSELYDNKWNSHYENLVKFHKENGHCYVFRTAEGDNSTLASWVHCQRKQKKLLDDGKHSQLNPQRIEYLDKIGFDWRPSESGGIEKLKAPERNSGWDELFKQVKQYKEKTGDFPKKKVKKIGNWISGQRRLYARNQRGEKTTLTEERITKLESIGFEWRYVDEGLTEATC